MSNASPTPAGGWYADPMDAGQLRWWDGANWTPQTTPAISPQTSAPVTLAAAPDPAPTPASGLPLTSLPATPFATPTPAPSGGIFPGLVPAATPQPPVADVVPPSPTLMTGETPLIMPSSLGGPTPGFRYAPTASPSLELPASPTPPSTPASSALVPTPPLSSQQLLPQPPQFIPAPQPFAAIPSQFSPPPPATAPSGHDDTTPFVMPSSPGQPFAAQPSDPLGYQPNPGSYVPFDPSAPRLDPLPPTPFGSENPYTTTVIPRPGLRSYASAPIGPSGSTYTGGLVFMVLVPLLQLGAVAAATQLSVNGATSIATPALPFAVIVIFLCSLAAAQFDRNALARRGYFDLASPFWILLAPPLVYLIVRAVRLRGQGKGGGIAIALWAAAYVLAGVAAVPVFTNYLSTPTPDKVAAVETQIHDGLASQGIATTVDCPNVSSFAPGSVFTCTATATNAQELLQITVVDWQGHLTIRAVPSTSDSTAASNS